MPSVPPRVCDRLASGLKQFQPILSAAKARDAGEADTATVVKDLLSEVFGYDKYAEITSEYAIRGTYCDLAVKLEGKLRILVEVKAIGQELKESHLRQAVDYAAKQGVEWVFLTNGAIWRIYRILFSQPISEELVYEADLLAINSRNRTQVENLFLFAKEGQSKSVLDEFHARSQATNRYFLGALVLSDPVLNVIHREIRRAFPGIKVEEDDLRAELEQQVLKRELTEGDKSVEARRRISKAQNRVLRVRSKVTSGNDIEKSDMVGVNADAEK